MIQISRSKSVRFKIPAENYLNLPLQNSRSKQFERARQRWRASWVPMPVYLFEVDILPARVYKSALPEHRATRPRTDY